MKFKVGQFIKVKVSGGNWNEEFRNYIKNKTLKILEVYDHGYYKIRTPGFAYGEDVTIEGHLLTPLVKKIIDFKNLLNGKKKTIPVRKTKKSHLERV